MERSKLKFNSQYYKNREYGKIIVAYKESSNKGKNRMNLQYQDAFRNLIKENIPLISIVTRNPEYFQKAYFTLIRCAEIWDYRKSTFSNFAVPWLRQSALNSYNYEKRKMKYFSQLNESEGLGNLTKIEDFNSPSPLEIISETEEWAIDLSKIQEIKAIMENGLLTKDEKYVMHQYYVEQKTMKEIGKSLRGVRFQRIQQIKQKAIRKIQIALMEKYPDIKVKTLYNRKKK